MRKFGIILDHLGSCQIAYTTIRMLNKLVDDKPYLSPYLFYADASRQCVQPKLATMHVSEIWGFDAPVIATTLSGGQKLKNSPGPTEKILYLDNLEWINAGQVSFEILLDSITGYDRVFARSTSHANAITSVFGINVDAVLPDGDIDTLVKLLGYDNNKS